MNVWFTRVFQCSVTRTARCKLQSRYAAFLGRRVRHQRTFGAALTARWRRAQAGKGLARRALLPINPADLYATIPKEVTDE